MTIKRICLIHWGVVEKLRKEVKYMDIEKLLKYVINFGKIIKYLFCLLLIIWCLLGSGYNLFVTKDYLLSILWLCAMSFPIEWGFRKGF